MATNHMVEIQIPDYPMAGFKEAPAPQMKWVQLPGPGDTYGETPLIIEHRGTGEGLTARR